MRNLGFCAFYRSGAPQTLYVGQGIAINSVFCKYLSVILHPMIDIKEISDYLDAVEQSNKTDMNRLNAFIGQISDLIRAHNENGKIYGAYKGRLLKLKKRLTNQNREVVKTYDSYPAIDKKSQWVAIQDGFLKIGHKPGGKNRSFEQLLNEGTTTVFTILSEREGARNIQRSCKDLGIDWIWLPLPNGDVPNETMRNEIINKLNIVKSKLQNKEKIYLHCSAGLHRTGMITNCILRFLGYDEESAYEIIKQLRPITAKEVGKKRLDFGNQFYHAVI
ncbi:protein-tyrosine phosphatase family protein [Rhodoflexus sp.]